MDYKELSGQLVQKCMEKGADSAEVYISNSRRMSIEVRNSELETVQESSSRGVGFRVFVEGKMGFSNCNDFSDEALDNTITSAIGFAKILTSDENNILPDNKGYTEIEGLYDPGIFDVSMDKKIEMAKEVEELAMQDERITKSSGSGYYESEGQVFLANSNGINKSRKGTGCTVGIGVVAEKGDQKSTGGEYCRRRNFADLMPSTDIAEKAAKEAYEMLDPRMVKTQRASVLFHPDAARSILGGILAAINGERVLQGASFLTDKVGKQISSELITIIDDGTIPKGMASTPFDGEGVPTQKRIIIDKGVLQGFMYNTIAAKRAGVESTGNASRGGYTGLPGIGPHSFYIKAGEHTPEEIIKATKTGLLLKGVTGYGINSVNGNFSGGASGFWIENGEIAFPVKGLTIAGNAFDMFNGIDMLGNDLDLNRTFTAPTFRIKEMQIGGE